MSNTISPNMSLIIPGVGTEDGPLYATDINTSLTIVDMHDHSAGMGVPITPNGLNINANLPMGNNFAVNTAGIKFTAQTVTPGIGTVYESGVDLYYVDGNSNNVRITQSGALAGTPGSIANLVSPASATYVAGTSTFVWQSNASIAANMDAGALILRNLSPNSTYGLTLQPPAALSSNYSLTLPTIPASNSFLTINTSGVISTLTQTAGITGSMIAAATITGSNIASATIAGSNIAAATIAGSNIALATITGSNIAATTITNSNIANTTITNSKLAALNFDTGTTSGSFSITNSTTPTFVTGSTVTVTTVGRPVMLTLSCDDTGNAGSIAGASSTSTAPTLTWYRDNVPVKKLGILGTLPPGSINVMDFPPGAGTYVYGLVATPANATLGDSVKVTNCLPIAYEL